MRGENNNMGQQGKRGESGHLGQRPPYSSPRPLGLHKPFFLKDPEVNKTQQPLDMLDEDSCWERYQTSSEGLCNNMLFQDYCKMKVGSKPKRDQ